jgi:hypothetical protein
MRYLFVGEKRSELAKKMKVTWLDGRLAAKQLFDALNDCGINPADHEFCNWFEGGKGKVRNYNGVIVAMGRKVSTALVKENIQHVSIIHPAARGKIRTKELYTQHVRTQLLNA